ncbi:hypothetical protein D3C81_1754320 [compost metagenome]
MSASRLVMLTKRGTATSSTSSPGKRRISSARRGARNRLPSPSVTPMRTCPSGAMPWLISSWASRAVFSIASACLSSACPAGVSW